MWRALHALNNNCSFQPSKLATAMTIVWEEKHDTWAVQVSDEHKDGWIASMVNRLRTALSHLSKALAHCRGRTAPPKWLELLLGDADVTDSALPDSSPQQEDAEEEEGEEQEEQEGEEGEEEEVSEPDEEEDEPQPVKPVMKAKKKDDRRPPDEPSQKPKDRPLVGDSAGDAACEAVEYVYGYCFERHQAWRTSAAAKANAKNREYTNVYAKVGTLDTDFAVCKWGEH